MTENLTWKYSKRPLNDTEIHKLERKIGYRLPKEYMAILQEHHGARPSKKKFDTKKSKGMLLKTFLPITNEYQINILSVKKWIKLPNIMVPFASTPNGDYLCFDYFSPKSSPAIVLWNHEKREKDLISISFDKFINDLYS
jgi:hypothetical protein